MRKAVLFFMVLVFGASTLNASAARDDLGSVFTAESDYLERLRGIKASCTSPDHFSSLLVELMAEIVTKVRAVIPELDERFSMFEVISGYTQREIDTQTLTLNRLNYLIFQLAISMNPEVRDSNGIFKGVEFFIQGELWQQPYDEALSGVNRYFEENLSGVSAKDIDSAENMIMIIFRPCDCGQWVFPLVNDNPIYGLKTYVDGFVDGILMTGLPLKAKNCDVHTGIIKPGEYIHFLLHDLLHNQTLAPSIDPAINKVHVGAMVRAVEYVLPFISALNISQQKKNYGILFWLSHELVNYNYSGEGVARFTGAEDTRDVLASMIAHSKAYADLIMNPALDDRMTYYRYYNDIVRDSEFPIGDQPFTIHNEDGVAETYLDEMWASVSEADRKVQPMDVAGEFILRVAIQSPGRFSLTLSTYNVFDSWPVQRAFVFSQALLMKYMGVDSGKGTYGARLHNFMPSIARRMTFELLNEFQGFFADESHEVNS